MFFGLCSLSMQMKVCSVQMVMRSSRVMHGCLMMLDGRMRCFGSHRKFPGGFKTEVQHPGYWTKGAA